MDDETHQRIAEKIECIQGAVMGYDEKDKLPGLFIEWTIALVVVAAEIVREAPPEHHRLIIDSLIAQLHSTVGHPKTTLQ